jgi:hypothetical protein
MIRVAKMMRKPSSQSEILVFGGLASRISQQSGREYPGFGMARDLQASGLNPKATRA